MDNFLHILAIWCHILGIALFVGPQFFLALAVIPATRQLDMKARVTALRVVTRRFAYIGGAGIVLIVLAGSYLIADWRDYYGVPEDAGFTDFRFGVLFIVKMSVFLVMLATVGYHTFFAGPKLIEALGLGHARPLRPRGLGVEAAGDEEELLGIHLADRIPARLDRAFALVAQQLPTTGTAHLLRHPVTGRERRVEPLQADDPARRQAG